LPGTQVMQNMAQIAGISVELGPRDDDVVVVRAGGIGHG
jgi:hypothetical protein